MWLMSIVITGPHYDLNTSLLFSTLHGTMNVVYAQAMLDKEAEAFHWQQSVRAGVTKVASGKRGEHCLA
jgi:hypothetical protein